MDWFTTHGDRHGDRLHYTRHKVFLKIYTPAFANLQYLGTTRTEIPACKPNVKLIHLLGSS